MHERRGMGRRCGSGMHFGRDGGADLTADFEEEPRTALRLVGPGIDQARSRIVLRRVRYILGATKQRDQVEIVGAELAQHVLRGDELGIIVLDRLVAGDIAY